MTKTLRLGTRSSQLARWQADWVAARLEETGQSVELVLISTTGDQQQTGPIAQVGTQGVFTKEIQRALLDNQVDLAVHSLKDLPTEPTPGLCLAAVPTRAAVGDALLIRPGSERPATVRGESNPPADKAPAAGQGTRLMELPQAARVGTGSTRRRAQLWHRRPDLTLLDIRGNVDTRIRKLHDGEYDAIILAEAGLTRLGLEAHISEVLPLDWYLPAVGQGALGIETRQDDADAREVLGVLDDPVSHACVLAERALLAGLRGGCLAPVGAWARPVEGELVLEGVVLSVDGRQRLLATGRGPLSEAVALGNAAASELLQAGAAQLIQAASGRG